jgi:hypothetical protein
MEKKWTELSPEEKRNERFKQWLSPKGIQFLNEDAERLYKERVTRLIDAVTLKEPDRVPVAFNPGHIPAFYSGYSIQDVMYDPEKLIQAWQRFIDDFELDNLPTVGLVRCGKALDILDSKMYAWPGHGVSVDTAPQYLESEFLKADEWSFIRQDPSDFQIRRYLPRLYGAAEPLGKLPPLSSIGNFPGGLACFADPSIQAAFNALGEAGEEEKKWRKKVNEWVRKGIASGLPNFYAGVSGGIAPLDRIGAGLRGTKGTIMDMFRQPDMLLEYMDLMVPEIIQRGIAGANISGVPIMFMPLHRGADGFMSEEQFLTFYWPFLKHVILGFVEEGLVPRLFAEGGYNSRLDIIQELPKGSVIWHFDQTDMVRAKEILGDKVCIMGNVSVSLLVTGTPDDVKAHCKELIETAGRNGGYIMAPGANADNSKLENLMAMMEAAKEYGMYKK